MHAQPCNMNTMTMICPLNMEILFKFVVNVRVIGISLAESATESPVLMENLLSIIGFICCKYQSTTNDWNSIRFFTLRWVVILKPSDAYTHCSSKMLRIRLTVEAPNVPESIMLYRHYDWTNNFNAILSCTHKSSVRKKSLHLFLFFDVSVLCVRAKIQLLIKIHSVCYKRTRCNSHKLHKR